MAANDKPTPILEASNVVKAYRDARSLFRSAGNRVTALNGVSLSIAAGEVFGLVGASGSGKTTLGRLILKLEKPDAGTIHFQGMESRGLKGKRLKAFRRKAQLIPQDPYQSLNAYMSVFDAVAEPLIIHGTGDSRSRKARVEESLIAAGLTPAAAYFGRYPHQLSGGERQRAAIARAMVLEPEFIVADEPTSMLDASISYTIFRLLAQIRKDRAVTFLFITHDLAAARFLCDRVAVIYHGEIIESGPTEEIINHPRNDYTKALIKAQPRFSFVKG